MTDVQIAFVTNRNYQPQNALLLFGRNVNDDGVAALRFGKATVSITGDKALLKRVSVYPEAKTDRSFTKVGSASFLDDLKDSMVRTGRDTIVYIHGFNVDFASALINGARLARNLAVRGLAVNVVVFTWPSDGESVPLMSYYSDRDDARTTAAALARAFLKLRDFVTEMEREAYCGQCLHLVAHSMGSYVLRNGLQALRAKDPKNLVRMFDQIVLAAADEDDDAFEHDEKLRLLPRIGRQVTVYFNPRDRALLISDKTKANPDRLGSDGPRLVDLLPKKVTLVDCRAVRSAADDTNAHSYLLNSPAMAADLRDVLRSIDPESVGNRKYVPAKRGYEIIAELAE